jgi:AcrR family transcriptional regulator
MHDARSVDKTEMDLSGMQTVVVAPAHRSVGRPRTFDDTAIFHATATVLAQFGPSGLTLGAVASELGCTAPALNKRFQSKQGLIVGFIKWSTERVQLRFDEMRAQHASPLAALRARFAMPASERTDEVADTDHHWNLDAFYATSASDPELLPLIVARADVFRHETAALLRQAAETGEIANCDPDHLTKILLAALCGVVYLVTTWHRNEIIEERLGEMVDDIVGPYRTSPRTGASSPFDSGGNAC